MGELMRAIEVTEPGGPEVLQIQDVPMPEPGPGQLRVRIRAAALNYADTLQRKGLLSAPGDNQRLGIELAGTIDAIGDGATDVDGGAWKVGERVFAIITAGAYAEYALTEAALTQRMPENWDYPEAAAAPEAFYVANETLFHVGGLQRGDSALIHAGSSGMGTGLLQLAHVKGITVLTTSGSPEKRARLEELGADLVIDYKNQDYLEAVREFTDGAGVDLVLDMVGQRYLGKNLQALKPDGRLIQIGLLEGYDPGELDLLLLVMNRLIVRGWAMRGQSNDDKRQIVRRFRDQVLPRFAAGEIRPVVDSTFPLEDAAGAHRHLESHRHFGKIVLTVD